MVLVGMHHHECLDDTLAVKHLDEVDSLVVVLVGSLVAELVGSLVAGLEGNLAKVVHSLAVEVDRTPVVVIRMAVHNPAEVDHILVVAVRNLAEVDRSLVEVGHSLVEVGHSLAVGIHILAVVVHSLVKAVHILVVDILVVGSHIPMVGVEQLVESILTKREHVLLQLAFAGSLLPQVLLSTCLPQPPFTTFVIQTEPNPIAFLRAARLAAAHVPE